MPIKGHDHITASSAAPPPLISKEAVPSRPIPGKFDDQNVIFTGGSANELDNALGINRPGTPMPTVTGSFDGVRMDTQSHDELDRLCAPQFRHADIAAMSVSPAKKGNTLLPQNRDAVPDENSMRAHYARLAEKNKSYPETPVKSVVMPTQETMNKARENLKKMQISDTRPGSFPKTGAHRAMLLAKKEYAQQLGMEQAKTMLAKKAGDRNTFGLAQSDARARHLFEPSDMARFRHSVNLTRFFKPCTLSEMGIENIIGKLSMQEKGGFNFDAPFIPLILGKMPLLLKNEVDIKNLMALLEQTRFPIFAVAVPETQSRMVQETDKDGNKTTRTVVHDSDRVFVFQKKKVDPEQPAIWVMRTSEGDAVHHLLPTLDSGTNVESGDINKIDSRDRGSVFLDKDQKKRYPLPHKNESSGGGQTTTGQDVFTRLLTTNLRSQLQAGRSEGSFAILAPEPSAILDQHAIQYLGHAIAASDPNLNPTPGNNFVDQLESTGCMLNIKNFQPSTISSKNNDDDLLKAGQFDDPGRGATILHITQKDNSSFMVAWNQEKREQGLMLKMDHKKSGTKLNGSEHTVLNKTPSGLRLQMEAEKSNPIKNICKIDILPSQAAISAHLLTDKPVGRIQAAFLNAVRQHGFHPRSLASLHVESHFFTQMHKGAISAEYCFEYLEGSNEKRGKSLAKALDGSEENFRIQCDKKKGDGSVETVRYYFKAPGKQQKNAVTGFRDSTENIIHLPPSTLLQQLKKEGSESFHILSTGPLGNTDTDLQLDYGGYFETLSYAGLSFLMDDKKAEEDFNAFVEKMYVFPPDISIEMYAGYIEKMNADRKEEDQIKMTRWLFQDGVINIDPQFPGHLIQFRERENLYNVTFFKNKKGELVFEDGPGTIQLFSDLGKVALADGWFKDGPVEVLYFDGKNVQHTPIPERENDSVSSGDRSDEVEEHHHAYDPAADTEDEGDFGMPELPKKRKSIDDDSGIPIRDRKKARPPD
jgi:hypothetical protein